MRKLLEKYRRHADFDPEGCVPITLSDGQQWMFPRPWLEITPTFREGRAVGRTKYLTCGPELDVLIAAIAAEEDAGKQVLSVMTLGAFLLLRNYEVTDEELGHLFRYKVGEPESEEMVMAIMDVATGKLDRLIGARAITDPKARAVGSGSA